MHGIRLASDFGPLYEFLYPPLIKIRESEARTFAHSVQSLRAPLSPRKNHIVYSKNCLKVQTEDEYELLECALVETGRKTRACGKTHLVEFGGLYCCQQNAVGL